MSFSRTFSVFCPYLSPFLCLFSMALSGCETLMSLGLPAEKPSASIRGVQLKDLSLTSSTLLFDVEVKNPYSVALPLLNLEYGLESKETNFLSGKAEAQGSVPSQGSRVIAVPVKVGFPELLRVLEGIRPGTVIPYTAKLGLTLDVPGAGALKIPLKKEGEFPIPAVPQIELAAIQWEALSLEKASPLLKVRVANKNEFPLDLKAISYGLTLGNVKVADSSIDQTVSFAAGQENTLELRTSFSPSSFGLAAFQMLTGKGSNYAIGGKMNVQIPFGPLDLPYEKSGKAAFTR